MTRRRAEDRALAEQQANESATAGVAAPIEEPRPAVARDTKLPDEAWQEKCPYCGWPELKWFPKARVPLIGESGLRRCCNTHCGKSQVVKRIA